MTLPPITKQQQAILLLIFHYRFLNRTQIQAFLNHKNKKTINTWLPDLVEKNYLKRIYSNTYGENTKPAIYYTGPNAIRFVREIQGADQVELRKRYREDYRKDSFIRERLLLADIALSFGNKNATSKGLFTTVIDSDFVQETSPFHFLGGIKPAMVLISEKEEGTTAYLLELFSAVTPRHSVRKRIRDWTLFFESGDWDEHVDYSFPIILFVCPDKPALIYAKRYVKKLKETEQLPEGLQLWFALEEDVRKQGVMSEIWEEVS